MKYKSSNVFNEWYHKKKEEIELHKGRLLTKKEEHELHAIMSTHYERLPKTNRGQKYFKNRKGR